MKHNQNHNNTVIDPVAKATTVVATRTLQREGIDKIRVVSQSMFANLVRGMVEESMEGRLANSEAPTQSQGPTVSQAQWEALRRRHDQKLVRIETGMRQLSATFERLQNVLETVGGEQLDCPVPVLAEVEPVAVRAAPSQQALLREMLL